jgi:salicylate hydroxylase
MMDKKFNIAIIGAGLGGLAAAIGIAKAGHRVTIIERAPGLAEVEHSISS